MKILEHLDKNNLHHAYLIEGSRTEILPEIFSFLEGIDITTSANPDFYNIVIDNFKIDDALSLRASGSEKSFSSGKKIFILSVNQFTLDAQGVLLKMFENPSPDTHFFLIMPDTDALLKTVVSRFYFISTKPEMIDEIKEAEKFISMKLADRIEFLKIFSKLEKDEDDESVAVIDEESPRIKASKFFNALEIALHNKMSKTAFDTSFFKHFFKVREFLRQPGSSTKSLMESVAIIVPNL
ncbi:MAG: hypothetical protein WAV23_01360 [Minisyncoccia bacterium]